MVTDVADFLRYSLERTMAPRVPLSDEIAAVRSYLDIEAIRFADKLHVRIEVEPAVLPVLVPPFVLLPLVENAIKHGLAGKPRRLQICIRAGHDGEALRLEVANTGRWQGVLPGGLARSNRSSGGERGERGDGDGDDRSNGHAHGTGTGLRNLEQRLAAAVPGHAHLAVEEADGWVRVAIALPASPVSPASPASPVSPVSR